MYRLRFLLFFLLFGISQYSFSEVINTFPYYWSIYNNAKNNWSDWGASGWKIINNETVSDDFIEEWENMPDRFWNIPPVTMFSPSLYDCLISNRYKLVSPEFDFTSTEYSEIIFFANNPFKLYADNELILIGDQDNNYCKEYIIPNSKSYKTFSFEPVDFELSISNFKIEVPAKDINEFPYSLTKYDPHWRLYGTEYAWCKSEENLLDIYYFNPMDDVYYDNYILSGKIEQPEGGLKIITKGSTILIYYGTTDGEFKILYDGRFEPVTELPISVPSDCKYLKVVYGIITEFEIVNANSIPEIIPEKPDEPIEYENCVTANRRSWIDINRDGIMDFIYAGQEYILNKFRMAVKGDSYTSDNGEDAKKYDRMFPINLNNDEAVDYYIESGNTIWTNFVAGSRVLSLSSQYSFIPYDYDFDGKTDFLVNGQKMSVQQLDGTFKEKNITILTYDEYINGRDSNIWGYSGNKNSLVISDYSSALNGDFFITEGNEYSGYSGNAFIEFDYNNDGRPDIINQEKGYILLNLGNDCFVKIGLGGRLYFRDLNNDQRLDYVLYNPNSKTVTANIYQPDGTVKTQKLITSLALGDHIWCYDFDNDGDIDILLPFDYSGSASFLLLMENDGNGKFKPHEYSYDEDLRFVECVDIDNDGYLDVAALRLIDRENRQLHWLKGNKNREFIYQAEPNEEIKVREYSTHAEILIADINNDGICEVITSNKWNSKGSSYELKNITPNTAPLKPSKPKYFYDTSSGFVKINWTKGNDKESSSADLTYALRIGTEPGKGDMYYAHALEDGTRLNLLDGNMGHKLDKVVNVSGWNAGKYYISVQTIDPMHKGSEWSDYEIFEKKEINISFTLLGGSTCNDTLTLALTSPKDPDLKYEWDMDGAKIISTSEDESIYYICYDTPGYRSVSLKVEDKKGNKYNSNIEKIYLGAATYYEDKQTGLYKINNAVDFNLNGRAELITENGIWESDGEGNYSKVKKIFNTDLTFKGNSSYGIISDITRNGLPDILACYYYDIPKMVINNGDMSASVEILDSFNPECRSYAVDFDNDGLTDFVGTSAVENDTELPPGWIIRGGGSSSSHYLAISKNNGDYINYSTRIITDEKYSGSEIHVIDINKDGLFDIIVQKNNNDNITMNIYLNKGNLEFEKRSTTVDISGVDRILDMNNDGYPDLVAVYGGKVLIALGDAEYKYDNIREIEIPIIDNFNVRYEFVSIADLDNNGYKDIILSKRYDWMDCYFTLYFYDDLKTELLGYDKATSLDYLGSREFIDWHNNGTISILDPEVRLRTNIKNNRPEAPTDIRVVQGDEFVTINWKHGYDKETPSTQLRYNLSVRKKGARDGEENSYVISPLNNMNSGAAMISDHKYIDATTYPIPLYAIPAGEYEVCLQTIDGWNMASEFSNVVSFAVEANPQIGLPMSVYKGLSADIEYKGNNPSGVMWNLDGGRILRSNNRIISVVWDSEGTKNISVTVDGVTSSVSLLVMDLPNTEFSISPIAIIDKEIEITMPDNGLSYSWKVKRVESEGFLNLGNQVKKSLFITNVNDVSSKAIFRFSGDYTIRMITDVAGHQYICDRNVKVLNKDYQQEIDIVTVDGSVNKNLILWTNLNDLPEYVTGTNIYKESNRAGEFYLLAHVDNSVTQFVDLTSSPNIMSSRYYLAKTTNLGFEMPAGSIHTTSHVMINKGINNRWNLIWSKYDGRFISSYNILRGTNIENLEIIANVSGNLTSYTDIFTNDDPDLIYAVEFVSSSLRKISGYYQTTKQPLKGFRANVVSVNDALPVILAENLIINSKEAEHVINEEQKQINLTATIYPLLATIKSVNWEIVSGEEFASVDSRGLVTSDGTKAGVIRVKATTNDGSCLESYFDIKAYTFTSVESNFVDDEIMVFPTVVKDYINITGISSEDLKKTDIMIYNMTGVCVLKTNTYDKNIIIDCSTLISGQYIVCVMQEGMIVNRLIFKQ